MSKKCSAGDDPKTLLMYFSTETQQDWRPGKREPDDAGGAFWLPGNVLLELQMLPPMSRGRDGDAQVARLTALFASWMTYDLRTYTRLSVLVGRESNDSDMGW